MSKTRCIKILSPEQLSAIDDVIVCSTYFYTLNETKKDSTNVTDIEFDCHDETNSPYSDTTKTDINLSYALPILSNITLNEKIYSCMAELYNKKELVSIISSINYFQPPSPCVSNTIFFGFTSDPFFREENTNKWSGLIPLNKKIHVKFLQGFEEWFSFFVCLFDPIDGLFKIDDTDFQSYSSVNESDSCDRVTIYNFDKYMALLISFTEKYSDFLYNKKYPSDENLKYFFETCKKKKITVPKGKPNIKLQNIDLERGDMLTLNAQTPYVIEDLSDSADKDKLDDPFVFCMTNFIPVTKEWYEKSDYINLVSPLLADSEAIKFICKQDLHSKLIGLTSWYEEQNTRMEVIKPSDYVAMIVQRIVKK